MKSEEFNDLGVGDIVQHVSALETYAVAGWDRSRLLLVRVDLWVDFDMAGNWRLVRKAMESTD